MCLAAVWKMGVDDQGWGGEAKKVPSAQCFTAIDQVKGDGDDEWGLGLEQQR